MFELIQIVKMCASCSTQSINQSINQSIVDLYSAYTQSL